MNILCKIRAGGIFSKMTLVLQNIEKNISNIDDIENIFIINDDVRINTNPYNFIYKQNENILYDLNINCEYLKVYTKTIPDDELARLKRINSKLIFNESFLNKYENLKNKIFKDKKYLGVHFRFTDMNKYHPEHGWYTFEDYLRIIDTEIKSNEYTNILVASDNNESIFKLKNVYGDLIIYNDEQIRSTSESSENEISDVILGNFSSQKYWEDVFLDMLLLSNSNTLIHRVSNFSNMAKMSSETITKVIVL